MRVKWKKGGGGRREEESEGIGVLRNREEKGQRRKMKQKGLRMRA